MRRCYLVIFLVIVPDAEKNDAVVMENEREIARWMKSIDIRGRVPRGSRGSRPTTDSSGVRWVP